MVRRPVQRTDRVKNGSLANVSLYHEKKVSLPSAPFVLHLAIRQNSLVAYLIRQRIAP